MCSILKSLNIMKEIIEQINLYANPENIFKNVPYGSRAEIVTETKMLNATNADRLHFQLYGHYCSLVLQ